MPYIKAKDRAELKLGGSPKNVGELNYVLSQIIRAYVCDAGVRYDILNGVVGVLECLKLEIYRRIAAPYEDIKIRENGDVFPATLTGDNKSNVGG